MVAVVALEAVVAPVLEPVVAPEVVGSAVAPELVSLPALVVVGPEDAVVDAESVSLSPGAGQAARRSARAGAMQRRDRSGRIRG